MTISALQFSAIAAWIGAIILLGVKAGKIRALQAVIGSGTLIVIFWKPLTVAIFGKEIGDDDAAMGAGLFWLVNGAIWTLALAISFFLALPRPKKAKPRIGER